MEDPKDCAIGKKRIGPLSKATLGQKGCASINNASKVKKENVHCTPGKQVHQECHCKYCAPNQISKALLEKLTTLRKVSSQVASKYSDQLKENLNLAHIVFIARKQ